MALEIVGKLIEKFPTQQIKENFSKREFVIEMTSTTNTGMTIVNYASFQLVNNNCAVIDNYQIGEDLKVSFDIRGNKWQKDGQTRYITNLNAWRVERFQQQQAYGQAPQQQGYSNPAPQQNFGGAPQLQQPPSPSFNPGNPAEGDDLPF
ncbi:MAG TPA: DUF3127 domain-containing protein [Edaphocola sp.]|nr:DUF3127 domain-containing protein [Edaphocola sp.]